MERLAQDALEPGLLARARLVSIKDWWTGYSAIAPIGQDFELRPGPKGFAGTARFSVGSGKGPGYAEVDISVPPRAVRKFFRLIATARLERGEYVPYFSHTDDFPSIEILLELPSGELVFSSRSQGVDRAPWRCEVRGETYTINSGTPMTALDALRPYLRRDTLDEVISAIPTEGPVISRAAGGGRGRRAGRRRTG